MAQCKNCGQQIPEGAESCANCGTPVDKADTQSKITDSDIQQNKSLAWLSYFGIFFLIPMLARKESEYCKFHVKQGVTCLVVDIIYAIVQTILNFILGIIFSVVFTASGSQGAAIAIGGLLGLISIVLSLVWILLLVLEIIGIVNAATGKVKEIPIIGKIKFLHPIIDKFYA